MNAREARHQAELQKWKNRVTECRSSNQSVSAWCETQGINSKTYYHWEREVLGILGKGLVENKGSGSASTPLTTFSEVPVRIETGKTAVTIRLRGIEADIHTDADAGTIETVLRVLLSC